MRKTLLVIGVLLFAASGRAQNFEGPNPLTLGSVTFGSNPDTNDTTGHAYEESWGAMNIRIGGRLTETLPASQFQVGIFNINEKTSIDTFPDYWRGALFLYNRTHDTWDDRPGMYKGRASNALTAVSMIASDSLGAQAEGIVVVAGIEPGGDGQPIAAEIGIHNEGSEVDEHADQHGPTNWKGSKTNIWLANYGSKKASYMIDAGLGTPWLNGIGMRTGTIVPGGRALSIPDQTWITVDDSTPLIYVQDGLTYLYSGGEWLEVGDLKRRLEALERRRR